MEPTLAHLTSQLARSGVVLLVALVARILIRLAIRNFERVLLSRRAEQVLRATTRPESIVASEQSRRETRHRQRVETLASILRNSTDVVLVLVTLFTILAIFDVPMAPIITSAGIGGVALGFGAQSLVKDYLSGIFMLAEDQFGVGDVITVGDVTGTVEEVTLRVTRVRAASGTIWYLRNGEILTLGNLSQSNNSTIVNVLIAPDEDPARAAEVVQGAVAGMQDEEAFAGALLEEPTVMGVGDVDQYAITLQVQVTALPNQQWAPLREVRARAQRALVEAGIRGPLLPGGGRSE